MYLLSISDQYRKLTGTPRKPVRSEAAAGLAARKTKAQ